MSSLSLLLTDDGSYGPGVSPVIKMYCRTVFSIVIDTVKELRIQRWFWCAGIVLSLIIRWGFRHFESGDYRMFVSPWFDFIVNNGGFQTLGIPFYNYSPFYLGFLWLMTFLSPVVPKIILIKSFSIIFDYVCAFYGYRIIALKDPVGWRPTAAFFIVLFSPTVIMNSALWGQVDALFVSGLLACVYYLMIKKETKAFIAYGLAFSFKVQSVFIFPLLLILLFQKQISWKEFLAIPLIYLIVMIPAWIAGGTFTDLLLTYLRQANYYNELTANAPNWYQWVGYGHRNLLFYVGLGGAFICTVGIVFWAVHEQWYLSRSVILTLALIFSLMLPFLLPRMHERYFFAADIFSILLAFWVPGLAWVAFVIQFNSFFSYFPFLFNAQPVSLKGLALLQGCVLGFLVAHFLLWEKKRHS